MPARNIVVVCRGSYEKKVNLGEVLLVRSFSSGEVLPNLGSAVAGGADAEGGGGVQSVLYTPKSASGTLNAEVLNARIMSRSGSGSRVLLFIQR